MAYTTTSATGNPGEFEQSLLNDIFKGLGTTQEQFLNFNVGDWGGFQDVLGGLTVNSGAEEWLTALQQMNAQGLEINGPGSGSFEARGISNLLPGATEALEDFYKRREIERMLSAAATSPNISQDQYNRLVDYTKANNAVPTNLGEFFGPTPMVRPSTWYAGARRQPRTYSLNKDTATGVPFKLEASSLPFYAYKPISNFGREVYDVFDQLEQSQLKAFNVDLSAY